MADAVPEKQVATALCPSCGRIVQGRQLRRVEWKTKAGKQHDYACYSCCYNVFPPGHPLFDRVQKWRAERGKSIVHATPERIAKYKGVAKVEDAKVAVQASSTLMKANDERMLEAAVRDWETGMIARDVKGVRCLGPECKNLITAPVVILTPESKKRRAVWGYCSQACADAFHQFLIKDIRKKPVLIPKYDEKGKTVVAYLQRGRGSRGWVSLADAGEPEFCPRCDRLQDVCDCTDAELKAFHKAAARRETGGSSSSSKILPPKAVRIPKGPASTEPVAAGDLGSGSGHGPQGDPAALKPVDLTDAGASSHETPATNPEASKVERLAAREARRLAKKLGEEAASEMEELQ